VVSKFIKYPSFFYEEKKKVKICKNLGVVRI